MKKINVNPVVARVLLAGVACCLAGCLSCFKSDTPYGSWALYLPFDAMNAGHLILERDAAGKDTGLLLWRWASPETCATVELTKNAFSVTKRFNKGKGNEKDPSKWRAMRVTGMVTGDEAACQFFEVDGFGKRVTEPKPFAAKRNPPIGAAPDLSKAEFGKPVDILGGTMDDFDLMNGDKAGKGNGWKLEKGVLSNRISRDAKGKSLGINGNLRTKRADFMDFNLKYEVRVLPGCNSGVYLRGIYEIQVLDSYGRKPDCHHMAAYYGRVAPSVAAEKPAGEWQSVDVTLWKRHLTVVLNGVKIIDNAPVTGITGGAMTPDEFTPGPLYIQGDHSDADFRNMKLTPILN